MYEKLKSFLLDDAIFTVLLLFLVGIISFGLGRSSVSPSASDAGDANLAGVILTQSEPTKTSETPVVTKTATQVVASRSGTKYHLLDCPGAKQIKDSNKIFFESVELAKAAGYTPAANCKGL
jgi:hypothetical protein